MRVTDPVADMLTRVRNGLMANKYVVRVPSSNLKQAIAELLKNEGYLDQVDSLEDATQGQLLLTLKYFKGSSAISGIKRVSRPGRRHYVKANDVPKILSGLGICVMTTSKGVMTGQEAVKQNVGGEVICEVW